MFLPEHSDALHGSRRFECVVPSLSRSWISDFDRCGILGGVTLRSIMSSEATGGGGRGRAGLGTGGATRAGLTGGVSDDAILR